MPSHGYLSDYEPFDGFLCRYSSIDWDDMCSMIFLSDRHLWKKLVWESNLLFSQIWGHFGKKNNME